MALSTSYAAIVSRGSAQASIPSTLEDIANPLQEEEAGSKGEEEEVERRDGESQNNKVQLPPAPREEVASHPAQRRPRPDKSRKPHQHKFHSYQPDFNPPVVGGVPRREDPHGRPSSSTSTTSTFSAAPRSQPPHVGTRHTHRQQRQQQQHRAPPLRSVLREMGCTEGPERDQARAQALAYVEQRLGEWVRQLAGARKSRNHRNKGGEQRTRLTDDAAEAATSNNNNNKEEEEKMLVTLIPFGSFRLGVHRPHSDLDCLVLTSANVTRHDFYASWVQMLRADPNVSHVHPIPNAYTPVLKFQLHTAGLVEEHGSNSSNNNENGTLQLDLLFASVTSADKLSEFFERRNQQQQLQQQQVTVGGSVRMLAPPPGEYYWIDNRDLPRQDAAGIRSLNGCRVTQIILQLIARGGLGNGGAEEEDDGDANLARLRLRRYQEMLCVVKQWAIQAGIYSNALGFLGGVNWAILAAWVCLTSAEFSEPRRLKSDAIVPTLLRRFYGVFGRWKWPAPVMLTPVDPCPPPELLSSVTTTASSSSSSGAFNELQPWNPAVVKRDSFHVMPILTPAWPAMNSAYNVGVPHLRRMQDELAKARGRIEKVPNTGVLPALFDLGNFVDEHRHFLVITMTTKRTEPADVHKQWCQFLESKLRLLVINLETDEIHPWPYSKFFHDHDDDGQLYRTYFCLALRFAPNVSNVNLLHLTSDWLQKINGWPGRTPAVDLKLEHAVNDKLPACVRGEIASCGCFPGSLRPTAADPASIGGGNNINSSSDVNDPSSIQPAGSGDWDSDDNGSRTSDKSYASVASSFSSELCQQTKRYRGDDGGGGGGASVENVQN